MGDAYAFILVSTTPTEILETMYRKIVVWTCVHGDTNACDNPNRVTSAWDDEKEEEDDVRMELAPPEAGDAVRVICKCKDGGKHLVRVFAYEALVDGEPTGDVVLRCQAVQRELPDLPMLEFERLAFDGKTVLRYDYCGGGGVSTTLNEDELVDLCARLKRVRERTGRSSGFKLKLKTFSA